MLAWPFLLHFGTLCGWITLVYWWNISHYVKYLTLVPVLCDHGSSCMPNATLNLSLECTSASCISCHSICTSSLLPFALIGSWEACFIIPLSVTHIVKSHSYRLLACALIYQNSLKYSYYFCTQLDGKTVCLLLHVSSLPCTSSPLSFLMICLWISTTWWDWFHWKHVSSRHSVLCLVTFCCRSMVLCWLSDMFYFSFLF